MKLLRLKKRPDQSSRPRMPMIDNQRPKAFQYSSKRSGTERLMNRGEGIESESTIPNRRPGILKFAVFGLLVVFAVVFLVGLSTNPQLAIENEQFLLRSKSEYQKAANEIAASKIQNRLKLTANSQSMADQMQKRFPELKSVDVTMPLFRPGSSFRLESARPALLFVSGSQIYVLDTTGKALIEARQNQLSIDTSGLPTLTDQTNYPVSVSRPAMTSEQIKYMYEVKGQLEAKQLKIESMSILSGGGELNIKLKDLAYIVKFNFYEDGRKSAGAYLSAKEQLEREKTRPAQYVDVRIANRAYVR